MLFSMKNIILFDNEIRNQLLPLTYTRPIGELRLGITTLREKWERKLGGEVSYITQEYLVDKFPINIKDVNYVIDGSVMPTERLCERINNLEDNEALLFKGELIAARLDKDQFERMMRNEEIDELEGFETDVMNGVRKITHVWDLFVLNAEAIQQDFEMLTAGRYSQPLSSTNRVIGDPELIFLEKGADVECCILNTKDGPIYIGENAQIMEGSAVRGPFAMGEQSVVKMLSKIYGATTLGPDCKVGGEINNSILTGHSNKAHDGFLGNSILGEWCNIGADSNNSNLKNTYDEVKLWDYTKDSFASTGLQFCGLIMGDHSKCGINTMFNTGTVVGVSANIFGAGFPRNFIPSFSWGGATGFSTYSLEKSTHAAKRVMERRQVLFDETERAIFESIFQFSAKYRMWEKSQTAS